MIELFKAELAEKIQQKSIGLAILFDTQGHILWHAGRAIGGKTLETGRGFSKSLVQKALNEGQTLHRQEEVISRGDPTFPQSASIFYVKSLFILPIEPGFLLYADSGNDHFSDEDIAFFHRHALTLQKIIAEIQTRQTENGGIAGTSQAMDEVRRLVIRYSVEADPVLLLGETGTGKSHIAQLIHHFSGRPGQLIIFDTPAVPETLFESELFGHQKGSFTSADHDRRGLVEAADQGTLFFDEISEVPLPIQAKLLRFIETRRYRPLGETRERTAQVRIIAATNRNLEDEVAHKRFRQDLYFRLNVLPIPIQPLRQRHQDIRALVNEYSHLLRNKELLPGFWSEVLAYAWPGNIRELLNVLKRIGIQHESSTIGNEVRRHLGTAVLDPASNPQTDSDPLAALFDQIASGKTFWETAWEDFLERRLNRTQIRSFLNLYKPQEFSLKEISRLLNITAGEYPRFISALHKYDIHPNPVGKQNL